MPYKTYGKGSDQRTYWVNQTKDPQPFDHGFAPNAANFIKKLVFHECSVPFQVYVETFVPAFLELLLFITIPYFDDIVRDAGEAIAGGGATSSRRNRRHAIRTTLPEPEGKAQRVAKRGLQTVLRLTQPLETIGYVFLLYAGTEKFFYNWNSALYGFEHCGKPPSEGPYQAHSDAQGLPINPAGLPLFMLVEDQNRASWPASNQLLTVPRGHYMVTIEATFSPRAFNLSHIGLELRLSFGVGFDVLDTGLVAFEPGSTGSLIVQAHVYFPALTGGTMQWIYYGDAVPIGVDIDSCSVSVFSFIPGL